MGIPFPQSALSGGVEVSGIDNRFSVRQQGTVLFRAVVGVFGCSRPLRACSMVNEIDGYKARTESQSSRPLPACWMVKKIARDGARKCSYTARGRVRPKLEYRLQPESRRNNRLKAGLQRTVLTARSIGSNLIHHRASSKGSAPRGAQVPLASNLVHHRASSKGSGDPHAFASERKQNRDEPEFASMATFHQLR